MDKYASHWGDVRGPQEPLRVPRPGAALRDPLAWNPALRTICSQITELSPFGAQGQTCLFPARASNTLESFKGQENSLTLSPRTRSGPISHLWIGWMILHRLTRVWIQAPPLINCVTSGKFLNLSELPFSICYKIMEWHSLRVIGRLYKPLSKEWRFSNHWLWSLINTSGCYGDTSVAK